MSIDISSSFHSGANEVVGIDGAGADFAIRQDGVNPDGTVSHGLARR